MPEVNHFGTLLKKLRKLKGLSIAKLAELSKVSPSYITRIEKGTRKTPKPEILKKLAPHLGVSYDELMAQAGYISRDDDTLLIKDENIKDIFFNLTQSKKKLFWAVADLEEETIDLLATFILHVKEYSRE